MATKKKLCKPLSSELLDITIGHLLGDGCLEKNKTCNNAVLVFKHGWKQKQFLEHLYILYQDYCFMQKVELIVDSKKGYQGYRLYQSVLS